MTTGAPLVVRDLRIDYTSPTRQSAIQQAGSLRYGAAPSSLLLLFISGMIMDWVKFQPPQSE